MRNISTRSQVFTHFGVQSSALGMGFQSAALDSKIHENSWFSTYVPVHKFYRILESPSGREGLQNA